MKFFLVFFLTASALSLYNCATDCMVEIDYDYRGIPNPNDLSYQSANSFQECCDLCSNDPTLRCNAWTFVFETKLCYLKTEVGYRLYSTGRISGLKKQQTTTASPTTTNPGVQTCTIESGFVYSNNDLGQPITLATSSDCCARCDQTSGCVAWSYLSDYHYCYLKTALPSSVNKIAYQNSYSGVLSGPAPTVCTIESNYIYPGFDLSGLYLANPSDCCDKCGVTTGCVAWDYLNDSKYCFMKTALPTAERKSAYQNAYSGVKR